MRTPSLSSGIKLLSFVLALHTAACSDDSNTSGNGGSGSPDGAAGAGGSITRSDASATGGTLGSGGAIATGGAVGVGGAIATGGAVGVGGAVATGGATGTGGAIKLDGGTGPDASIGLDGSVGLDGPRIDGGSDAPIPSKPEKVIIFVWDGLRPDSVSTAHTPNLAKLRDQTGVNFTDNHAVFPTFTMMNGAAFATGSYPATHGFFGNTEYQPGPTGKDSAAKNVDFSQPIFTEDWSILHDIDAYYAGQNNGALFLVDTLFQAAHRAGLKTAAVGKSGPAFLQDYREDGSGGVILDENMAFPKAFATALLDAGLALPANTVNVPYDGGAIALDAGNGNPTATTSSRIVTLNDNVTSDPRAALGSPHDAKNEYMMNVYTSYILPKVNPDLTLIWFRNPDSTEHTFGPGSPNYVDALEDQDKLLGQLQAKLVELGLDGSTDIIVVSDHGHSIVAGDPAFFPLRGIDSPDGGAGAVGAVDPQGYSVSGDVRTADLLKRAGFTSVYDGIGCTADPVLSGIKANGDRLYPTQTDDASGTACGKGAGFKYNTGSFVVPSTLPADAIVIAANGGSDYLYVPSHDATLVKSVVTALQQRKQYGPIFVRSTYGAVDGTLSLKDINVEGPTRGSPPTPDIIVSFDWNDTAVTASNVGLPGTEYESAQNNRGMHGSFGPSDVHNTLIAGGPSFKVAFKDTYPSGNVDVAPTAASLLGLGLPQANGRILKEALRGQTVTYTVTPGAKSAGPVTLAKVCNPDDPTCATPAAETSYTMTLTTKTLTLENNTTVTYFDKAKATRQ